MQVTWSQNYKITKCFSHGKFQNRHGREVEAYQNRIE